MNLGFSADGLVFMVVVPELGACRVPDLALSHFMAGADEYAAEGMPEHWSKQPSGPWTIKRDRLRILADSWDKWHQMVCDRWITEPPDTSEPQAPPVVENSASNAQNKARRDLLTPVIEAAQKACGNVNDAPAVWAKLTQMAETGQRPLLGVSDDGIKWQDANDEPQFFKLRNLRDRLRRISKKAL